jgi:hypothetical protein
MKKSLSTVLMVVGIAVIFFCIACAGNYGGIKPDQDVTKAFDNYQINPDAIYYVSGPFTSPNALIGVYKTYTLDSDLWRKIEPTQQEFREIIKNMQEKALRFRQMQHGFAILDEKGKPIGVWYSIMSVRTMVQTKGDRKVVIFTPELDTYGEQED